MATAPVTATVKRLSDRAALLEVDGEEEWVPLSLIEQDLDEDDVGEERDLDIASWKARELGWD